MTFIFLQVSKRSIVLECINNHIMKNMGMYSGSAYFLSNYILGHAENYQIRTRSRRIDQVYEYARKAIELNYQGKKNLHI